MRRATTLCLALAVASATLGVAQEKKSTGFVVTLGQDTIAVEWVERTSSTLTGFYVERVPRVIAWWYTATLRPDGSVERFELRGKRPGGQAVPSSVTMFAADQATVEVTEGDSTRTLAVPLQTYGTPWLRQSYGLYEQSIVRAKMSDMDSMPIAQLFPGSGRTRSSAVWRVSADTMGIAYFGLPMLASVDESGHIMGLTGRNTTGKVEVERVADLDVEGLLARFEAEEMAKGPVGSLSPRDTVNATIGTATLWVDYSRPSKRGRVVFGNLAPWNDVWRTGANSATHFNTSVDLQFGDVVVPAGTYTLWTIPTEGGATLIINTQTDQWGTWGGLGALTWPVKPL